MTTISADKFMTSNGGILGGDVSGINPGSELLFSVGGKGTRKAVWNVHFPILSQIMHQRTQPMDNIDLMFSCEE